MPPYFHLLRRKIGVMTLLVACMFMAGWVRSLTIADMMRSTSLGIACQLLSTDGNLAFKIVDRSTKNNQLILWRSAQPQRLLVELAAEEEIERYKVRMDRQNPSGALTRRRIWTVPYLAAVIPLTVLSAWLLLSNPRAKQKQAEST